MKYYDVHIVNNNMDISVDSNTSLLQLSKLYKSVTKYPILIAKVDNIERDLNYRKGKLNVTHGNNYIL